MYVAVQAQSALKLQPYRQQLLHCRQRLRNAVRNEVLQNKEIQYIKSQSMRKTEKFYVVLFFIVLLGFVVKLLKTPDKFEVEKIVLEMLENPEICKESNPEQFLLMKKLDWNNSGMRLKIKASALPKRVDYYAINSKGEIIAEIIYSVNARCNGIYINSV